MSDKKQIFDHILAAVAYERGLGQPLDFLMAAAHFHAASELGSDFARERLEHLKGKGAFGDIDLKRAIRCLSEGAEESFAEHDGAARKILVVDDGEETLTLITYMLAKSGYEPIAATDGVDALEKTLLHPDLDCMLIDLQMPNMNGFEFISALRAQKAFDETPIIIVTAYSNPQLMEQGRKLGVSGWLHKPVRKDLLVGTVQKALRAAS